MSNNQRSSEILIRLACEQNTMDNVTFFNLALIAFEKITGKSWQDYKKHKNTQNNQEENKIIYN